MSDQIRELLSQQLEEFSIVKLDYLSENQEELKFLVELQTKSLKGENYDEMCNLFIEKFSSTTHTSWITKRRYPNPVRYNFRKEYICQHAYLNKVTPKQKGAIRNYGCSATINIKFIKVNRNTMKNNELLKRGYSVYITINYNHSHRLDVAEAFGMLRCNKETEALFESYFQSGMTPSTAMLHHEMYLLETYEDTAVIALANAQINPQASHVIYLYNKWRRQYFGNRNEDDVIEVLERKKIELIEKDFTITIKKEPLIVVLLTPLMKRVFRNNLAEEMIFIDSSGACDQSNTCITFIFVATKIGAIPLCLIFHNSESELNYMLAFQAAKESLFNECGIFLNPQIIMTDDSSAERNALRVVFTESTLLLCSFHVTQAVWRWLWNSNHNVKKEDRQQVMNAFRKILYAKSAEEASDFMQRLLSNQAVRSNTLAQKYFERFWQRRQEWCLAYRDNLMTRGNNTNNFCEASIRIFKDVILQRCKAFNVCALVEFASTTLEKYHTNRILSFANSRKRYLDLAYKKFGISCDDMNITKIDENTFQVEEGDTECYTVYVDCAVCNCNRGKGGKFCKHIFAIERDFNIFFKTSLLLSEEDKLALAKLALGENVSQDFFKNMMLTDDLNSAPTQNTSESLQAFKENPMSSHNPISETALDEQTASDLSENIKTEFNRISEIISQNMNTANSKSYMTFLNTLKSVKTPSQLMSFIHQKISAKRSRKIRVQPTSIARRASRGRGNGRIQSGRPTTLEQRTKKKRQHNISSSIELNQPHSKKH